MAITDKKFREIKNPEYILCNGMANYNFFVPDFQRNYSWNKNQIDDLLEELFEICGGIKNTKDVELYLGTILLNKVNTNDETRYEIIDGQQRITTIMIIIKAIIDISSNLKANTKYRVIENEFFDKFEKKMNYEELKEILHTIDDDDLVFTKKNSDKKRMQYSVKEEAKKYNIVLDDIDASDNTKNQFRDNYNHIKKAIEGEIERNNSGTSLKEDFNYIYKLKKIVLDKTFFLFIYLDEIQSAFSIFESINTKGLQLTSFDLISGAIRNNTRLNDEEKDIFSMKCEKLKENYNLNNLIHYYFLIYDSSVSKKYMYNVYKERIKSNESDISGEVKNLNKYLEAVEVFEEEHYELKYIIDLINRKQLYSFIYSTYMKNSVYNEEAIKLIKKLIVYSIGELNILEKSPGNNHKYVITEWINLYQNNSEYNDYFNIERFEKFKLEIKRISLEDSISNLDIKIKKALLIYDFIQRNTSVNLNISSINLEHILPQKPSDDWKNKEGWKDIIDDEIKFDEYLNSYGNLMLLNEKINKRVQNKYIDMKEDEIKKAMDDTLKNDKLNKVNLSEFTPQYIKQRENEIISFISSYFEF